MYVYAQALLGFVGLSILNQCISEDKPGPNFDLLTGLKMISSSKLKNQDDVATLYKLIYSEKLNRNAIFKKIKKH